MFSDCQLEQLKDLFKTCFTKSDDRSETSNDRFEQLNESMGLLVQLHRANRALVSRVDVDHFVRVPSRTSTKI